MLFQILLEGESSLTEFSFTKANTTTFLIFIKQQHGRRQPVFWVNAAPDDEFIAC